MKKISMFILFIPIFIHGFSQNAETKRILKEIEGQWEIDDNNNITYNRIFEIEGITKDELYERTSNFFIYNYRDANSVIQTEDKQIGRIIGKGKYEDVHYGILFGGSVLVSTWHILRVDVKDGKARAILTLTNYDLDYSVTDMQDYSVTEPITSHFPINSKGPYKNVMGKAFYQSHIKAMATLNLLEKSLKEGSTNESIEKDEDW